jgi:CO dehydrogenase nickel-insertion accessory protein CooC1
MKKVELVAQLETIKTLSSQVDIDKVIELINKLDDTNTVTKLSEELIEEIIGKIENSLDCNSNDLVDKESAEFSIGYGNTIELDDCQINVYDTMEYINSVLREYEAEDLQVEAYNENFGSDQDEEIAE